MRTLRRTLPILAVIFLAMAASACTGDDPVTPSTSQDPGTSIAPSGEAPVTSNTEVRFKPGEYHYLFRGVNASLKLDASRATLKITNSTGSELGAPSAYAITGDGLRYDGKIEGAESLPDGATVTLDVTFPDAVTAQTVGLMVLGMGSATLGAMPPVPLP